MTEFLSTPQIAEKKKFIRSLNIPVLFLVVIWVVKLFEIVFHISFAEFGVFPRKISGLVGIIASPLIHSNIQHLFSNSIGIFILLLALFYFYAGIAFRIFLWIYLLSGVWLWLAGRPSYHIGASGIVYGLVGFLFFSGVFRKDVRLAFVSLLVVFLFGDIIWGIFPISKNISFESHLAGLVAGIILAFFFRNQGPKSLKFSWQEEPDEPDNKDFGSDMPEEYQQEGSMR